MFDFFPKGVSVITVVVLGVKGGQVVTVNKFRLAKSQVDMEQRFPLRADGSPVIGPRVYRERTKAELKAAGLTGTEYLSTLVPLSNCGAPYWVPQVAQVAA